MTAPAERLSALDAFRGATIAAMLLVNDPGTWSAVYAPLRHAPWHGWTPPDLIFPFFLFIVGVTTHLSLTARRARGHSESQIIRKILKRGAAIVLVGLLLNAFPYFTAESWTQLRFPGVLQRIGVAYVAAALLTQRGSLKTQVLILVALLYGYWFAMTLLPVPGRGLGALQLNQPDGNLAAWLDRAVFGTRHLWSESRTWDPEGLLSTIPAIGTAMLGVFTGRWLGSQRSLDERLGGLFFAGFSATVAGVVWGWSFPINKNLWTSSYVLFTAGLGALSLAACLWLVDRYGLVGWARAFLPYGVNPLPAYVGAGFMAGILEVIHVPLGGESVSLKHAIFKLAFASWLPTIDASLAFALAFVAVWYLWALSPSRSAGSSWPTDAGICKCMQDAIHYT
jgi:predicted acyltransferase